MDEIFEGYPELNDPDLLYKLYKKRELYYNKIIDRNVIENYDDIKKYRDENCKITKDPKEFQIIVPHLISPDSPYKGLILMYGVGIGKTMTAIRTTEQFKEQVKKYNTKIYIIVSGPNAKENFKKELINSTNNVYFKNINLNNLSKKEIEYEKKIAINNAMEYYKIISYKSLYKKVLGEKIIEKKNINGKLKNVYKKTKSGEYERDLSSCKITNMNDTIIVIDEAHNIIGNEYGETLKKLINQSKNLKILLLTATPMINYADQIIELINYLRPENDKILRDKIFTSEKNYLMGIKDGGIEYLKKMAKGYISYMRGMIPFTFAERINMGEIPNELIFTPLIKCYMNNFQYENYIEIFTKYRDSLDNVTITASNFIFPMLDKNNNLKGIYNIADYDNILNQINENNNLVKKINEQIFNNEVPPEEIKNILYLSFKKRLTGIILKKKYIKHFSTKFYEILSNLNNLKNGTAFVYSNLVKVGGIELFSEVLLQNGYLEYNELGNYSILDNTLDYKTGLEYQEYIKTNPIENFYPAVFLLVTGSNNEDMIPEQNQFIIQNIFNHVDNINGKNIKIILGSSVMNEAITLKNCREVHIIDALYNIPRIEQIIGRAVRMCVHMDLINNGEKYPQVKIYKYVASVSDKKNMLSSDELLYKKAELKYLTIKIIERALKEISIDCPLLINGNIFPEDIKKYKNCIPISKSKDYSKDKENLCPALCDFTKCEYKCDGNFNYEKLKLQDIDYSTFTENKYSDEILFIINKIKDLYRYKYVYTYDELYDIIINNYTEFQKELFNKYFLDIAIEKLLPKKENDFNTFTDIIYDKYNNEGYLINRDKYFIFQRNDKNENINMYYRKTSQFSFNNCISLEIYIDTIHSKCTKPSYNNIYNFDDVIEYYLNRKEYKYIGIIDININKHAYNSDDIFKIRKGVNIKSFKKRGTGIPTFKGGVCSTSKNKKELLSILNSIPSLSKSEINKILEDSKENICNIIKEKFLYLEKHSTDNVTYVIIPKNHPIYPFPYNINDRLKYIKSEIYNINESTKIDIKKTKNFYNISISQNDIKKLPDSLETYNFKIDNGHWVLQIDISN